MISATLGRVKGLIKQHALLSANMLSVVADIPQVRLSAALRGATCLSSETEAELLTLATRAVKVIEAIFPLQVQPGDGATLKLLVNNQRDPEEIRQIAMLLLEPNQ